MKYILASFVIFFCNSSTGQQHRLEKIWETDSVVAVPESVLFDSRKRMYVSLIDGAPWEADGRGGVARINAKGKKYDAGWITGLHAPKGLGLKGRDLYVADLSDVVVIDTKKGKIRKRIPVPNASGLNDVTVADNGSVYVSDSRTGRIWKIDNDVPQLFMDTVRGVNGLKAVGTDLLVAAGKNFIRVNAMKQVTVIAELPMGGDGIEPVGNGDYLVTTWSGVVYYVSADGKVETLLDTMAAKKNTADIGYDPVTRMVFIPTFNAKTIAAYQLK